MGSGCNSVSGEKNKSLLATLHSTVLHLVLVDVGGSRLLGSADMQCAGMS